MKLLALDSSGLTASVAYTEDSVLRAEYTVDYKKTHSQTLLPMLGKPLIEVPTLAALAYNLFGANGLICPIMDARRSQVYNGLYCFKGSELVTLNDQRALSVEDLAFELNSMNPEQVILLGDGVQVYRERLDSLLTVPHLYAPPSCGRQRAASVASYGAVLFSQGKAIPGSQHAPLYLRKSQAEREREQKGLS